MDKKFAGNWFFTKPKVISKYLLTVFKDWGYAVYWNMSDDSESVYQKICLGTRESPKSLHIRISDHSIPTEKHWVTYQFDVYCGFEREGATNYIKLLLLLAEELNKPLPPVLEYIKTGTKPYRSYRIEMQRRKKMAKGRSRFFREERLYV